MIKKITNKITKIDVNNLADLIASRGEIPTIAAIRAELQGRGSETTIHNYLKEWKKDKLLAKQGLNAVISNQELFLIEEKRDLEQALHQQITKNENYAKEIIQAENSKLHLSNQELRFSLTAAQAANDALEKVMQKIQKELNLNTNENIQKMQQTIDNLRQEIKILNETSIYALRDTSNQGHEVLMQEKVNSINLQAKIDSLTKELLASKKQLHEAIMTAQVQNRSLSRQNEQLQRIIQQHGLDKLLEAEPMIDSNSNNEVAVYGK